jgi:hypothetical protein
LDEPDRLLFLTANAHGPTGLGSLESFWLPLPARFPRHVFKFHQAEGTESKTCDRQSAKDGCGLFARPASSLKWDYWVKSRSNRTNGTCYQGIVACYRRIVACLSRDWGVLSFDCGVLSPDCSVLSWDSGPMRSECSPSRCNCRPLRSECRVMRSECRPWR